tara:strand:- start:77 stop:340 length:264 start_codon:yes stop_codon:yes gene_type:complete
MEERIVYGFEPISVYLFNLKYIRRERERERIICRYEISILIIINMIDRKKKMMSLQRCYWRGCQAEPWQREFLSFCLEKTMAKLSSL